MTTKGWKENDFKNLAKIIIDYLTGFKEGITEKVRNEFKMKVLELTNTKNA